MNIAILLTFVTPIQHDVSISSSPFPQDAIYQFHFQHLFEFHLLYPEGDFQFSFQKLGL
jgi:hypothetical protein